MLLRVCTYHADKGLQNNLNFNHDHPLSTNQHNNKNTDRSNIIIKYDRSIIALFRINRLLD